jgi:hypothetical protein
LYHVNLQIKTLLMNQKDFSQLYYAKHNGTMHFKNINLCLNTNNYSYLETSGGQSYDLYLNFIHFSNTSVNKTSVAA